MNEKKVEKVKDLSARFTGSSALVLTDYRGLTVSELKDLRGDLRKAGAEYRVVKNTLARIAARECGKEDLAGMLNGPMAISFSDDAISAVKALNAFIKDGKPLELIGGYIDDQAFGPDEVKKFADIPPRDVLLATMLMRMNGPISGLVNVLAGPMRGLAVALNAIAEQKTQ